MTTFYTLSSLEDLPGVLKNGIDSEWSLYQDKRQAEDRWDDADLVLLSVEIEDPDSMLGPDNDEIDSAAEFLMSTSRPATAEDEVTGFIESWSGAPITWDDPEDLATATALKQYENGTLGWKDSVELLGSAQLDEAYVVEPAKISLLSSVDPEVLQSIETKEQFSEVVAETEPVALSSLGASFWVWLLMMIQYLAFGKTPFEKEKTEASSAKKRARKSKRKKAKKKAAKAPAEAGEAAPE
jgi:hypothetical protein